MSISGMFGTGINMVVRLTVVSRQGVEANYEIVPTRNVTLQRPRSKMFIQCVSKSTWTYDDVFNLSVIFPSLILLCSLVSSAKKCIATSAAQNGQHPVFNQRQTVGMVRFFPDASCACRLSYVWALFTMLHFTCCVLDARYHCKKERAHVLLKSFMKLIHVNMYARNQVRHVPCNTPRTWQPSGMCNSIRKTYPGEGPTDLQ